MSISLFYRETGEGPPLLILHGVFGSGDNWLTVSKNFSPFFNVFLLDQRNHGRSPQTEEFGYDLLVQDVKDFADQHNLKAFYLIGHSMGGKVAMKFAAIYPERILKLVIVDIAPRFYSPHHQDIVAGLESVNLGQMTSRNEADQAMAAFIPELDVRQFLLKNLYRTDEGRFAWRINLNVLAKAVNSIGEALDPTAIIQIQTLFIKGANSRYISEQDKLDIKHQFPNSKLLEIAGAGHWVQAERPEEFSKEVINFLKA
jgi:pimeloyl-ACP methyl ester carboxylesterase